MRLTNRRIIKFRKENGIKPSKLGIIIGMPKRSARTRIYQYENDSRTPRENTAEKMADFFDVSVRAILADTDDCVGVMHTFFSLEDFYGAKIAKDADGKVCIKINPGKNPDAKTLEKYLKEWQEKARQLVDREITRKDYDHWRYNFSDDADVSDD